MWGHHLFQRCDLPDQHSSSCYISRPFSQSRIDTNYFDHIVDLFEIELDPILILF